jgi:DnaJ-class molecular chaperone
MTTNSTTLMSECRECSGAGLRTHDQPNDPYARTFRCETCEGTGEAAEECNDWNCRGDATEWVDGAAWCAVHGEEQRADALS